MTREEAIAIIENEKECVNRANKNDYCNRDCYNCELVKTDTEILTALDMAIKALEQAPCREADDYENEISDLYNRLDIVEYDKERLREEVTTLEEKLKGLSAEPCGDAISRQAAIDVMCALCNTGETLKENPWRDNPHIDAIIDALDNLPSVTPQPKTGVLEQKTCVTMRNLSDKELKHFVEEMKKVRPQVIRQEPCADAISRQAVIDVIERWLECSGYNEAERHIMRAVQSVLYDSPSVNLQEPKTGHWIAVENEEMETVGYYCSECDLPMETEQRTNFCPNCGAKMQEVEE